MRSCDAFDPPRSRFGAGHLGVDLAAPRGTPVHAAGSGCRLVRGFGRRRAARRRRARGRSAHVVFVSRDDRGAAWRTRCGRARSSARPAASAPVTTDRCCISDCGRATPTSIRCCCSSRSTSRRSCTSHRRPIRLARRVRTERTARAARGSGARRRRGRARGRYRAVGGDRAARPADGLARRRRGVAFGGFIASQLPAAGRDRRAALATYWSQRGHCDPHAPDADGTGGSDHRVMIIAGLDSSITNGGPSIARCRPAARLRVEGSLVLLLRAAAVATTPRPTPKVRCSPPRGASVRNCARCERRSPGREVDLIAPLAGRRGHDGVPRATCTTRVIRRIRRWAPRSRWRRRSRGAIPAPVGRAHRDVRRPVAGRRVEAVAHGRERRTRTGAASVAS